MVDGSEGGEGEGSLLTAHEAAQRTLEGIRRVGALDLTPPLNKPLTGQEAERTQIPNAETLRQRQEQIALGQSLEEARKIREAESRNEPAKPPETPQQRFRRLTEK